MLWSRCFLWRRRATRLRRLLSIADCADLRIVPTFTRHALRSGRFLLATSAQSCPGARLHSCASARLRAGFACCYPDPRRRDWSESAGTDEVSPRASRALLRMSTCDASVRFRTPRLGPLGLCRPRRPVSLFCRGVHERGRHNPQVGTIGRQFTTPNGGATRRSVPRDRRLRLRRPWWRSQVTCRATGHQ